MTAALNAVGLKLAVSVPLDPQPKSFDAEVKDLLDSKLDCVLFTTNAQPISTIVDRHVGGPVPWVLLLVVVCRPGLDQ